MEKLIRAFAKKHEWKGKNLLLALSGGVDSMVLFHLLDLNRDLGIKLHIAHVDHGWREESSQEAKNLETYCKAYPFYLQTLSPTKNGNLENESRKARYAFFFKIIEEHRLDGLIVGHHKDDQTETVFKRLLEGASLPFLAGMLDKERRDETILYRPLLPCAKNEMVEYAQRKNIPFIEDKTNHDSKFLRARMRKKILPQLCKDFKKDISEPLLRVASDARMLRDYLEKQTQPIWNLREKTPWGDYADFSSSDLHPIELHYFFQKIARAHHCVLGKKELEILAEWIKKKSPSKQYSKKKLTFCCDRGHFLLHYKQCIQEASDYINTGKIKWGNWTVYSLDSEEAEKSSWRDWLKGSITCQIPRGLFKISFAKQGMQYKGKTLFSRYAKAKVPSFFRPFMPLLIDDNNQIIPLCLKSFKKEKEELMTIKILLD